MKITGTFIDEITMDIPSNNWTLSHWKRDFKAMKHIGIDTVIIIRAGLKNKAIFQSKTLGRHVNLLPVYSDLAEMFLTLAEENRMSLFWGTYDSNEFWQQGLHQKEIDINRELADEVWEKYGSRKAFKGWYISQELARKHESGLECIRKIARHCKNISNDLTTLISPYMWGGKQFDNPITIKNHEKDWDYILSHLSGAVDIVAFQDGHVDFDVLGDYLTVNNNLIKKHGMKAWSNLETFDRDMPFNFPPIDWRKLWWKMEVAKKVEVEKIITFEFSHFMSPHSLWPSARTLYEQYCEHFSIENLM